MQDESHFSALFVSKNDADEIRAMAEHVHRGLVNVETLCSFTANLFAMAFPEENGSPLFVRSVANAVAGTLFGEPGKLVGINADAPARPMQIGDEDQETWDRICGRLTEDTQGEIGMAWRHTPPDKPLIVVTVSVDSKIGRLPKSERTRALAMIEGYLIWMCGLIPSTRGANVVVVMADSGEAPMAAWERNNKGLVSNIAATLADLKPALQAEARGKAAREARALDRNLRFRELADRHGRELAEHDAFQEGLKAAMLKRQNNERAALVSELGDA